jgi:hypothetical protein
MAYTSPSITASGTTFAQLVAGGVSGHLERLITANKAASAAPTAAATATPTGGGASGGSLAAGTYYFVFTESDGVGETTASPQGAQLTVGSTNIPQFTFPSLQTGNVARNLYLGTVNGTTGGPYFLYATGITTTTYNAAAAAPSNSYAVNPPTVNNTAFTYTDANGNGMFKVLEYLRLFEDGRPSRVYLDLREMVDQFLRGEPMTFSGATMKLRHAHTTFAMLSTLCAEIGTLFDANPGTLTTAATGIGGRKGVRTQP